jgi:hypothetical protein
MAISPLPGPAWRRFTVGNWHVTALADGTTTVDLPQVVLDRTPDELAHLLAAAELTNPATISINAYVLDDGTRCLLLDTGADDLMGASAGRLPA